MHTAAVIPARQKAQMLSGSTLAATRKKPSRIARMRILSVCWTATMFHFARASAIGTVPAAASSAKTIGKTIQMIAGPAPTTGILDRIVMPVSATGILTETACTASVAGVVQAAWM